MYRMSRRVRRYCRPAMLCLLTVAIVCWIRHAMIHSDDDHDAFAWDASTLRDLMSSEDNTAGTTLEKIMVDGRLSFFHLAKRRSGEMFTEITSANPDAGYPLAPDFTFHIHYRNKSLVLYEDYGPGCLYRIFLLPILPTDYSILRAMTARNMTKTRLVLAIDGRQFSFNLSTLMEATQVPFLKPMSTQHGWAMSGVGAYTPFCYKHNATLTYVHDNLLPRHLLKKMRDCSRNDRQCPVHLYSSVSRLKFAPGTWVESYAVSSRRHDRVVERAALLLSHPEVHGPDGTTCSLQCSPIPGGTTRLVYQRDKSGVVASFKVRAFETATHRILNDWSKLHLVVKLDSNPEAQINVSLGSIFMSSATSDNEFAGAFLGRMARDCHYATRSNLPLYLPTNYLYLPIPFWRSARISVKNTASVSIDLCYEFTTVENFYREESTGYLRAQRSCYSGSDGWRDMLTVERSWGHVVGVLAEVNGLRADSSSVVSRWAALQADTLMYIDGVCSASMLGTGFEDYFSYAHGFARADNTSYAFVGLPYASPSTNPNAPRSWHCYRLHALDPVPFQQSLQMITEGIGPNFLHPQPFATCRTDTDRPSFNHLVLYYTRPLGIATSRVDVLALGDLRSERRHQFRLLKTSQCGAPFTVDSRRYLGAVNGNNTYFRSGRSFCNGSRFCMKLQLFPPADHNRGAVLRRESHSVQWNEAARIWMDGSALGRWFIPMGALSERYSLRQADFLLPQMHTNRKSIRFEIEPSTAWDDISYTLIPTL